MNIDTFFEQFDSLIELPGGVAKIRELVLQLAVQGKLVEQDASEGTASELLDRIVSEKSNLVADGVIRRGPVLSPVSDAERLFPIPVNWTWARFADIGDWGSGATPSRQNSAYYGGSIPWFKSGELNDGYLEDSEEKITAAALSDCSLRENKPGDVLLAMYGATIGKVAILRRSATTNQAVCACTCFSGVDNRFLFVLLKAYKSYFIGNSAGAAQPNFSKDKIIRTPIPLPPLAEQRRIVAKVDQLMALCDELEARQERKREGRELLVESSLANLLAARNPTEFAEQWRFVRDNFDKLIGDRSTISALRQTILHLAVRGRIDAPEPNDTPVSRVLAELEIARKEIAPSGNARVSVGAEAVQPKIPLDLPPTWGCECLGSLAAVSGGVTLGRKLEGKAVVAKPYLRVANVQQGFLDLTITKTVLVPPSDVSKFRLQPGDVLLTEGGDWDKLGRSAVWNGEIADCLHQNHIFRARLLSRLLRPEWVSLFTNSPVGRRYFQDAAKQTTNLATINMAQLRSCPIPVPPPESQDRVLAKVTTLMGLCDDLQERLERVCTSANGLLDYAIDSMGG